MKTLKRILTLVMALAIVASMVTVSFADTTPYSIKVTNMVKDKEYKLFKVFSATTDGTNITYFSDSELTGDIATYFTRDASTKKVTINDAAKDGNGNLNQNAVSAIGAFVTAKLTAVASHTATDTDVTNGYTFTNLEPGYYYVTTTTGTAVMVCSTKKTATIKDKNEINKPTPPDGKDYYKSVKNAKGSYLESASAKVGDTVDYKIELNATQYNDNDQVVKYVFTDTFKTDELGAWTGLTVKVGGTTISQRTANKVEGFCYDFSSDTATTPGTTVNTITVYWSKSDDVTASSIVWGESISADKKLIEITYSSKVLKACDAENKVEIKSVNYKDTDPIGDNKVVVYTYDLTIQKVGQVGSQEPTALAGASFELYTASEGGAAINLKKDSDGVYHVATAAETSTTTEAVCDSTGKVVIKGLQGGCLDDKGAQISETGVKYYISEKTTPDGYVGLSARQEVKIDVADASATVLNTAGTELPTTGGIGTTLFYVFGVLLVAGAVIAFITKKRVDTRG